MHTPHDATTLPGSGQPAGPAHLPPRSLVNIWARGRRQITPWAYPHLRSLAAVRFAIGIFLAGLGAVMFAYGYHAWAALPLAGAVLHFSIAYLDITVARSASVRT